MRTLTIIVFIAFVAITACNNNSNVSNNSSSDSSSKDANVSGSDNNSSKTENNTANSENNSNKNAAESNKRATRTAFRCDYEVAVGASFSIELASNPTTGFRWHWVNRNSVSTIDSTGYSYKSSGAGKMGSGGAEVWTFTGRRSGTDTIKFQYNRSWEKKPALKTQVYSVNVK